MEWFVRQRDYRLEVNGLQCLRSQVSEHPLKSFKVNQLNARKAVSNVSNTPKTTSSWTGLDPLSLAMHSTISSDKKLTDFSSSDKYLANMSANDYIGDDFENWSMRKTSILNKYTTSERLSIKTSFLATTGNTTATSSGTVSSTRNLQNTSVAEKVKHRLEQLDDFEEGSLKEMLNLTQQEYVNRIEELNTALHDSWESDQRVKALKIAIQCAKLLADVSVIQFYPSKFVLITDILDNFGSLVYKRIHNKAGSMPTSVESARETCRNWFYKIASIRELIPRFYVESAILKVYGFLIDRNDIESEYKKALKRLSMMIRGIGDPLVAIYARAYLSRIIIQIAPNNKDLFQDNFNDFLRSLNQLLCSFVQNTLTSQRITYSIYFTLFTPALDWILYCIAYKTTPTLLNKTLINFKQYSNVEDNCSALILNSFLTCFPSDFIASRANEFLELIKKLLINNKEASNNETDNSVYPKYILIRNFGLSLVSNNTFFMGIDEKDKLFILNEIWKLINKLKLTSEYMNCVEAWFEFVVIHFGLREINTLLGDVIKHMTPNRAFEQHYNQLISVISKVMLNNEQDFAAIFSMTNFMPFLDLLQKESIKVNACKIIVESFAKRYDNTVEDNDQNSTSDPVILNSLTYLCKTMHDSVNALTLDDERRQIASLVISFLRRVSFNKDFESQLNFYVDSRANFNNLEPVLCFLVQRVNYLAMETRNIVKGHHTKKTNSFVNSCLAFSFITIPSIDDIITRLQQYLSSSYVALINTSLPQTDSFLKASITLIQQLPQSIELPDGRSKLTEPFLTAYISQLLSFLLLVPDNPEQECLYLFKGLLNVINIRHFEPNGDNKAKILIDILKYLSAAAQQNYCYHIAKVDSNDTLYGNDSIFMDEISTLSNSVLNHLLDILKKLGDEKQYKRQANISIDLFHCIVSNANIQKMFKFLLNLWQLAHKNSGIDNKKSEKILRYFRKKAQLSKNAILLELITKLESL